MPLADRLAEYISAGFSALWIQSFEHEDALKEVAQLCRDRTWRYLTWDVDQGLQVAGQAADVTHAGGGATDPLAAIRSLHALASNDGSSLLVLKNFHRFLGSAEIVQALDHQIARGKREGCFVVVLSSVVQVPVELEKVFVVIEHDLPSREQLGEIAHSMATEDGDLPTGDELERVLDSAAGLTRFEAEGAYSLSLVRHGRITSAALWELKSQMLKKSGLLQLYRGRETFADLGGLTALKQFCLQALRRTKDRHPEARPKGILLLSPPGCGKSQFCKALGNETGRPTLILDVGALMGSLVGETERNIRQALRLIDAMAPCVVMLDEVEKALSGAASSGQTDSGVSARLFGSFLTWLSDHETDVFCVCTSNDISKLPPEFSRAERFDGLFFLDLPSTQEKQVIWRMYIQKFGLDAKQSKPRDQDWTGAEIRSCCRLASLLDVPLVEAAKNIVPVAVTASESVEKLRRWASGRCLSADTPGVYRSTASSAPSSGGRRVQRDPSAN